MAYRTKHVTTRQGFWVSSEYGPRRGYFEPIDVEVCPFGRALRVMRHYERANNAEHWAYRLAQKIANQLLLDWRPHN